MSVTRAPGQASKRSVLETERQSYLQRLCIAAARWGRPGTDILRLGLVIVLLWIGGLKFANYEADSIVPMVANSPFMKFVYHYPAPQYRPFMNKEGELIPAHRKWHTENGTYTFSHVLGAIIIGLGLLIACHPVRPAIAVLGSFLLILMSFTTLSLLVSTPEAWVQPLGDANHGFPYLSGMGRLILKDAIMFGAAIVAMADSARSYLFRAGLAHQR